MTQTNLLKGTFSPPNLRLPSAYLTTHFKLNRNSDDSIPHFDHRASRKLPSTILSPITPGTGLFHINSPFT
jgi:hypothetical protein